MSCNYSAYVPQGTSAFAALIAICNPQNTLSFAYLGAKLAGLASGDVTAARWLPFL